VANHCRPLVETELPNETKFCAFVAEHEKYYYYSLKKFILELGFLALASVFHYLQVPSSSHSYFRPKMVFLFLPFALGFVRVFGGFAFSFVS